MPAERVAMRRVREILRLHHQHGLGCKRIARSRNVSKNTVLLCLQRAAAAGLGWPLPDGLDNAQLDAMLYAKAGPSSKRPEPNWRLVERELHHRGMTRRHIRQKSPGQQTPIQAMKDWQESHPKLFIRQVRHHSAPETWVLSTPATGSTSLSGTNICRLTADPESQETSLRLWPCL